MSFWTQGKQFTAIIYGMQLRDLRFSSQSQTIRTSEDKYQQDRRPPRPIPTSPTRVFLVFWEGGGELGGGGWLELYPNFFAIFWIRP